MKILLPLLILSGIQTNAAEYSCPYAESLMHQELEGQQQSMKGYSSIIASGSPPSSPRGTVFNPTDQEKIDKHIRQDTNNNFEGISESDFAGLEDGDAAYLGLFHLDITPKFPFPKAPMCVHFDDFSARGSVGIGLCEYSKTMIRLLTTDHHFLYLRPGINIIRGHELFNFCRTYELDICQLSIPHFMITFEKTFSFPNTNCPLTNTPLGIVKQKYKIEFDPSLAESESTQTEQNIAHEFNLNSSFSFVLTDITHSTIYASGSVQNKNQLFEFTPSRFSYGCLPSPYGDCNE